MLIVGSVALDSVRTPFGERAEALGGSASYSAVAASFFSPARMVAVVGEDFPEQHVAEFGRRGVDVSGLQRAAGKTFRWGGYYEYDMSQAHTTATELNVFQDFRPELGEEHRQSPYVFLANIDPGLQLSVLDQVRRPKLVACDTMNYWIENAREKVLEVLARCDIALMNDAEARQLSGEANVIAAERGGVVFGAGGWAGVAHLGAGGGEGYAWGFGGGDAAGGVVLRGAGLSAGGGAGPDRGGRHLRGGADGLSGAERRGG